MRKTENRCSIDNRCSTLRKETKPEKVPQQTSTGTYYQRLVCLTHFLRFRSKAVSENRNRSFTPTMNGMVARLFGKGRVERNEANSYFNGTPVCFTSHKPDENLIFRKERTEFTMLLQQTKKIRHQNNHVLNQIESTSTQL